MSRKMVGFVQGGMLSRQTPSPIQPGDLAIHAIGRLDTMAEILVQSICLRSIRFVRQATGFGKAQFQDVTGDYSGTNKIAAAHRAIFALHLDGQNAANVAQVSARTRLKEMVVAPQARTDLVSRPVNYADQLLENAISDHVFALYRSAIERQRPGQPVEKNLIVDTTFRLKRLFHDGFDRAADAFREGQRKRGFVEFRFGSGPAPLAGVSDSEIDDFLDRAFDGGMKIQVAGPTHYGDLTETILGISQEITDRASPAISTPENLEKQISAVESAAAASSVGGVVASKE
jgi:hypothetical protein